MSSRHMQTLFTDRAAKAENRRMLDRVLANKNLIADCGCKFENDNSNSVILCEKCSEKWKSPQRGEQ